MANMQKKIKITGRGHSTVNSPSTEEKVKNTIIAESGVACKLLVWIKHLRSAYCSAVFVRKHIFKFEIFKLLPTDHSNMPNTKTNGLSMVMCYSVNHAAIEMCVMLPSACELRYSFSDDGHLKTFCCTHTLNYVTDDIVIIRPIRQASILNLFSII